MAQLRGYLAAYGPPSDIGMSIADAAAAVREVRDESREHPVGASGPVDQD